MKKQKVVSIWFIVFFSFLIFCQPLVLAEETNYLIEGEKIFNTQCSGCHLNGGNIIRRNKNLKQKALKRNGFETIDDISFLVSNGKNNMSAFKERLTEKQIKEVSTYVLYQAEHNWR